MRRGFNRNKIRITFLALCVIFIFSQSKFLKKDQISAPIAEEDPPIDYIQELTPTVSFNQPSPGIVLGSEDNNSLIERQTAKVVKIKDGDTIYVDLGGGNIKTVRYIGIDTPESVDPRRSVQCFGIEASSVNKSLVENQTIQLEKDVSETDKYGRLLRYVYSGDVFVNKYLVEEGYAHASAYPPDIKYQEDFESAEGEARLNSKGLWGACQERIERSEVSNSTDRDCSEFKTQNEAQVYFESIGGSKVNNADKLDGSDRDGQVCESLP